MNFKNLNIKWAIVNFKRNGSNLVLLVTWNHLGLWNGVSLRLILNQIWMGAVYDLHLHTYSETTWSARCCLVTNSVLAAPLSLIGTKCAFVIKFVLV